MRVPITAEKLKQLTDTTKKANTMAFKLIDALDAINGQNVFWTNIQAAIFKTLRPATRTRCNYAGNTLGEAIKDYDKAVITCGLLVDAILPRQEDQAAVPAPLLADVRTAAKEFIQAAKDVLAAMKKGYMPDDAFLRTIHRQALTDMYGYLDAVMAKHLDHIERLGKDLFDADAVQAVRAARELPKLLKDNDLAVHPTVVVQAYDLVLDALSAAAKRAKTSKHDKADYFGQTAKNTEHTIASYKYIVEGFHDRMP